MTPVVLDASALLAMILREPGGERVHSIIDGALLSAVNLAEVAGLLVRAGASREQARRQIVELPMTIVSATVNQALDAAALLPATRAAGLSLGDRFCLALARAEGRRVMTADRAWASLDLAGLDIELIR